MGIFTLLLLLDGIGEIKRHNRAMERAALTPAERAAEDKAYADEEKACEAREIKFEVAALKWMAISSGLFLVFLFLFLQFFR